jgi:sugar lactone lactonase YvrE
MSFAILAELVRLAGAGIVQFVAIVLRMFLPRSPKRRIGRAPMGRKRIAEAAGLAFAVLSIGGMALSATAQTTQFAYAKSQVAGGFNDPRGVAVDGSGNVYVADSNGTGNSTLWKETPSTVGYTQTAVDTALRSPDFIAVDANGNIYVSTDGTSVIKETPSGGGYIRSTVATGFSSPIGVAVDSSGAVYVGDTTDSVYEETPNRSGGYSQTTILSDLQNIQGLAVEAGRILHVYVATSNDGKVTDYQFLDGVTPVVVASGLSFPEGVAADGSGNVYVAEAVGSQRILKETLISGFYIQSVVASGLGSLYGLALDGSGNIYYSDQTSKTVQKLQTSGGANFFAQKVGSTSSTLTLGFVFGYTTTYSVTLGNVAVLTQGASGLDFANAGSGTCTSGTSYGYASSCTVNVTFTPSVAGMRYGAVSLYDSSGNVLATAYVYGTGVGPQVAFSPGTPIPIATGTSSYGVELDGASNLYIADGQSGQIVKQTPSGAQTMVGNTSLIPTSLAVDGSGAVYVTVVVATSTSSGGSVLKETPLASGQYTQSVMPVDVSEPWGIAADGSGNVYVTDPSAGSLQELSPSASGGYTERTIASGLLDPVGAAVDASGNVYLFEYGNGRVLEYAPSSSGGYTQSVVRAGLNAAVGLAVDGAGNLYIGDLGDGQILKEVPTGSGAFTESVVPAGGPVAGYGLALDGGGNLYIADPSMLSVLKLDTADVPTLSFVSTAVGQTSTDSPQTLTLQNIGNAPLIFSTPSSGTNPSVSSKNFALVAGSTCPSLSSSSSPATIAAGASCTELASFGPQQAGTLSGSLLFSDNNLNQSSTQSVSLSGMGTPGTPTISVTSASFPYGTSGSFALLSALIAYGGTVPTGQVSFMIDGLTPLAGLCNVVQGARSCSAFDTYSTLNAGIHSITVNLAADANYNAASGTATLTIAPISPTVTVPSPPSIVYAAASATLTAQIAYGGPAAPTGAVRLVVDTGSSVTATCTPSSTSPVVSCTASYAASTLTIGTHTITAALAADTNYTAATGTGTLTVTAPAAFQAPTCTLGTAISAVVLNTIKVAPSCTEPQALPITATINWGSGQPTSVNLPPSSGTVTSPAYTVSSSAQNYTVVMHATDSAGLAGTATLQVTIQPVATVAGGSTTQFSTTVPASPGITVPIQVTFVCSGVSGTVNGVPVSNSLPSAYGITCSSPTVTVPPGATTVPVNVTIVTNSPATVAALHGLGENRGSSLLAVLLPLPGLLLPLLLCNLLPSSRRKETRRMVAGLLLLCVCVVLGSCSSGFAPPPPVVTPQATFNLTIVEQDLTVPTPSGFVQTSLIVPLAVH